MASVSVCGVRDDKSLLLRPIDSITHLHVPPRTYSWRSTLSPTEATRGFVDSLLQRIYECLEFGKWRDLTLKVSNHLPTNCLLILCSPRSPIQWYQIDQSNSYRIFVRHYRLRETSNKNRLSANVDNCPSATSNQSRLSANVKLASVQCQINLALVQTSNSP